MAEILSKNYLILFRFEPFFTDIYTLCSCIEESQKDKKSRGSPKLGGQNSFEIQLTG